jgi:uncharacterized membrane protein YeiH
MTLLEFIEYAGTFVFAVSGALTARSKGLDVFGVLVIAFVTAIGGGTIRDILLGYTPVGWMHEINFIYIILLGVISAYVFKHLFSHLRHTFFLFDTLGIGVFTILGLQKTLALELSPLIAVMMGTVSAVFGGVLRDILCNEVPLIFRKEIYATACITGALAYILLMYLNSFTMEVNFIIAALLIIGLRISAIVFNWSLPRWD